MQFNTADFLLDVVSMDYRTPDAEKKTRERVEQLGGMLKSIRCYSCWRVCLAAAVAPMFSGRHIVEFDCADLGAWPAA